MKLKFRVTKETEVKFLPRGGVERLLEQRAGILFQDAGAPSLDDFVPAMVLEAGEKCKSWAEVGNTLEWMSGVRLTRRDTLVALGGGAALDFTALVASLYQRGMPLVFVPTTLLAMVDATLGGKTAVDGPGGLKNFAGTFYPADEVWIHCGFLKSLPRRERISGAGECWKTLWLAGITEDKALIRFVRNGQVGPGLEKLVRDCLAFKRKVVERDPLDVLRVRESLNFGHTVGHALEALAEGRISHGEAVIWGMMVESALLGPSGAKMRARVEGVIDSLSLARPREFSLPEIEWRKFLSRDKKVSGDSLEMTVLAAPGKMKRVKLNVEDVAAAVGKFGRRG